MGTVSLRQDICSVFLFSVIRIHYESYTENEVILGHNFTGKSCLLSWSVLLTNLFGL